MRTIQVYVYKYEELSDRAKEKALHNFQCNEYYPWVDEDKETLKAFEQVFPIKVTDWEYGYQRYVNFRFEEDDAIKELTGIRLATYIYNNYFRQLFKGKYYSLWSKKEKSPNNPNMGKLKIRNSKVMFDNSCVFTGYYMDDVILEPVYKFLKNPCKHTNFKKLIRECLEAWVNACDKNYHDYYSEENFIEMCNSNNWEFYENGNIA